MWGLCVLHVQRVLLLWITVSCCWTHARHVPLSSQRPESRPRLLVIRPPNGSSQPNRVVILTNPRVLQNEADSSPTRGGRGGNSRVISLASIPGLAGAAESPPPTELPADNVGGHPQSQARQNTSQAAGGAGGAGTGGGRRSLRQLLQELNKRRSERRNSNIAPRTSDTIPRAAPPILPTDDSFGRLIIPTVIERALKRARERARMMGNVQPVLPGGHVGHGGHVHGPDSHGDGHVHVNAVDLSQHNSARSRQFAAEASKLAAGDQPATNSGKDGGSSFTGSGLRSFENRSGRRRGNVDHHQGRNSPDSHNHDLHLKTSTKLKTSTNGTIAKNDSKTQVAAKSRVIQTKHSISTKKGNKITPVVSKETAGVVQSVSKSASAAGSVASGSAGSVTSGAAGVSAGMAGGAANSGTGRPGKVATVSLNGTASLDSASANSTSNTTSTKKVKTKTIKVTTVVKGGGAREMAAAAASQAEIAHAVSQGAALNSTDIAAIAAKAAQKNLQKASQPPAGSITVKRQNGISVITLADGIGEPVVIRATGPVKIERIIKPDGKVQFVINPVGTSPHPATTTAEAATVATAPAASAEMGEVEPEDFTTTTIISTTPLDFAPTSDYPFMFDSPPPIDVPYNGAISPGPSAAETMPGLLPLDALLPPALPTLLPPAVPTLLPAALPAPATTTTVQPEVQPASKTKPAAAPRAPNTPLQLFPIFEPPKIPRPPPTIPRPPPLPHNMFGNQGLMEQLAASFFPGGQGAAGRQGGQGGAAGASSTAPPRSQKNAMNALHSDIHMFNTGNDVMPQYDVVKKSPNDVIVK